MNDSQLVRALTRLSLLSTGSTPPLTGSDNGTAVDIRDYVGAISIDLLATSLGSGSSPTLDVAVRTGATTSAMALVSGGAFAQVTTAFGSERLVLDTRVLDRYIDVAYTVAGTGAVSYAAAVIASALKQNAA